MMQTDVQSRYLSTSVALYSERTRIKGLAFKPTISTSPNIAFVNPNVVKTGTYSQTGGAAITVTCAGHGFVTGQRVALVFTTGTASSGAFGAIVSSGSVFLVSTSVTATTSGNVSIYTDIGIELGIITTAPYYINCPGEGVLFKDGVSYVGTAEVTVFYG